MILSQKSLEMPITRKALATSEQFASQQPHHQEQEQVRLNTLAVLAVHDYLELMDIETELEDSDSWNPVVRLCEDVADLMVKGLGQLECRPVLPDSESRSIYHLPPEVWEDRIGYVVVEIDKERKKATLLGFAPTARNGELLLRELQPLTDLLKHLESLTQSQVNLSQWLNNIFPLVWQEIETIFPLEPESTTSPNSEQLGSNLPGWLEKIVDTSRQIWQDLSGSERMELQSAGAFRSLTRVNNLLPKSELMRAKLIDLGVQLGSQTVVLLLALTQESEQKLRLIVQMYPIVGEEYLPANLKLALLSESEETLQEVTSRTQDRGMQLKPFKVRQNTNFKLKITLGDFSLTETFSF
ncbi:MAG: DUF1822 family protein [Xenococcaceae cyanobacterium MO_207.B15]|nr:DUF1822 family protein [Xenococcaceae cyanobacterium MO_207.B15]